MTSSLKKSFFLFFFDMLSFSFWTSWEVIIIIIFFFLQGGCQGSESVHSCVPRRRSHGYRCYALLEISEWAPVVQVWRWLPEGQQSERVKNTAREKRGKERGGHNPKRIEVHPPPPQHTHIHLSNSLHTPSLCFRGWWVLDGVSWILVSDFSILHPPTLSLFAFLMRGAGPLGFDWQLHAPLSAFSTVSLSGLAAISTVLGTARISALAPRVSVNPSGFYMRNSCSESQKNNKKTTKNKHK